MGAKAKRSNDEQKRSTNKLQSLKEIFAFAHCKWALILLQERGGIDELNINCRNIATTNVYV